MFGIELVGAHISDVQLLHALHPVELIDGVFRAHLPQLLCLIGLLLLTLLAFLALEPDHQVVVNVGVEVVLVVTQLDVVPFAVVDRHG